MGRPKNAPQGEQTGTTEENVQDIEAQGASPDQNPGENADQQGEGEGNAGATAQENTDTTPAVSTDETKPDEGEKPSERSTETETDGENPTESEAPDPALPTGTVIMNEGKEYVKVGYPNEWLPKEKTIPPEGLVQGGDNPTPAPGTVKVISESRKGQTIIAASGQPIVIDNEGNATVSEIDALYLKQMPGFIVE
ncbi:hypothetical protein FACS1894137_07360 [Spirochaetia bacterium]|nr:hypothetical protein FACS1894137_07360 [Spirochaetia bacterium]